MDKSRVETMKDETRSAKRGRRPLNPPAVPVDIPVSLPPAPHTLEGWCILHQMFRLRRKEFRASLYRDRIAKRAVRLFEEMERREDGESAIFSLLGHKGDLIALHFRREFAELGRAEQALARLELGAFLKPVSSFLSVLELGLYEATFKLNNELAENNLAPGSPGWTAAASAALAAQREKLMARLYQRIPERRYLCFYPMNRRREGKSNWYLLPFEERRRLMHDHGLIGRRYAGAVTQIISGATGFDDWEWGVDLFADEPLVFKKLIYEMRFDEASASYAEFGPFYVGERLAPAELREFLLD